MLFKKDVQRVTSTWTTVRSLCVLFIPSFKCWKIGQRTELCRISGSYQAASHHGAAVSVSWRSMFDLWLTKWYWERIFYEFGGFTLSINNTHVLNFHLSTIQRLYSTSIRGRTSMETVSPHFEVLKITVTELTIQEYRFYSRQRSLSSQKLLHFVSKTTQLPTS
jgi:hypothetical protein